MTLRSLKKLCPAIGLAACLLFTGCSGSNVSSQPSSQTQIPAPQTSVASASESEGTPPQASAEAAPSAVASSTSTGSTGRPLRYDLTPEDTYSGVPSDFFNPDGDREHLFTAGPGGETQTLVREGDDYLGLHADLLSTTYLNGNAQTGEFLTQVYAHFSGPITARGYLEVEESYMFKTIFTVSPEDAAKFPVPVILIDDAPPPTQRQVRMTFDSDPDFYSITGIDPDAGTEGEVYCEITLSSYTVIWAEAGVMNKGKMVSYTPLQDAP